ncbi:alpha/beta hydrolase [Xylaria flabelliformis]|nr:alpha/beta hydrolase [Xylaria flabelliformis]
MHRFFKGQFFNFEVARILGMAPYGGADIAEVIEAVGQIRDGDPVSWAQAWQTQADRARELADEAFEAGQRVLARRAYLRAANYTRAAGYMIVSPDPRQRDVCEKVNALFHKAAALFDCGVHYVSIPHDGGKITLPAHLYLPPPNRRVPGKIPMLICNGGADALQEELYFMHPAAGPDLGYAVLTFEGPGQGLALKRDGVTMRPDWELVGKDVLDFIEDYASSHPELELDTSRIATAGASLGAYFALRASVDPRIKACVALDPLFSFWDFAMQHVSTTFIKSWERGWLSDYLVDIIIGFMMKMSFKMNWEVNLSGGFFGIKSPALILKEMKHYSLSGGYLGQIKCPVLVSGASDSLYLDPSHHTKRVFDGLVSLCEIDKELWMSTTPGQGSLQAKMGAMQLVNQKTFKFLDAKLYVKRPAFEDIV